MKNLFENTDGILEAENILKKHFTSDINQSTIIGSLPVSPADCSYLMDELFELIQSGRSISFVENIPLCILTAWTFAVKYEYTCPELKEKLIDAAKMIQQHHYRFYIDVLSGAMAEYSISDFGYGHNTITELSKIIRFHTGEGYTEGICA